MYIQRCAESRVGNKCEFEYQPTNSTDATIFGIWIVANFNETDIMWLKTKSRQTKTGFSWVSPDWMCPRWYVDIVCMWIVSVGVQDGWPADVIHKSDVNINEQEVSATSLIYWTLHYITQDILLQDILIQTIITGGACFIAFSTEVDTKCGSM